MRKRHLFGMSGIGLVLAACLVGAPPAFAAASEPMPPLAAGAADADALWRLGQESVEQGALEQAVTYFQKAVALNPTGRGAIVDLGIALSNLERWEDARKTFEKLLANAPDDDEALNGLGYVHYRQERVEDAIACYRRAISRREDPQYHLNLGLAYLAQDRYGDAEAHFSRTLDLAPAHYWGHNNLGYALQLQGRIREAATHYEAALSAADKDTTAHFNYGAMLADQGDWEGAAWIYRELLKLDDTSGDAHLAFGTALYEVEMLDTAYLEARVALQQTPDWAEAHHLVAKILRARGETAKALDAARLAVSLDPKTPDFQLTLGILLEQDGQTEAAAKAYSTYLELVPDREATRDLRWRVRVMREQ